MAGEPNTRKIGCGCSIVALVFFFLADTLEWNPSTANLIRIFCAVIFIVGAYGAIVGDTNEKG